MATANELVARLGEMKGPPDGGLLFSVLGKLRAGARTWLAGVPEPSAAA